MKRKRSTSPEKKSKARRKGSSGPLVKSENRYGALSSEHESESDMEIFESTKGDEVVLVESDDDSDNQREPGSDSDIVVESDEETEESKVGEDESSSSANRNEKLQPNELSQQQDFIEFDFSSSEDEALDPGEYSDDGVLSNDDGDMHTSSKAASLYPWIKDHDHSKQKEIADWLTKEIKDFVNYISPSKKEIQTRNQVVTQLKSNINKFWPETEAHVFGSCATDLYLPGSDIDMVVVSTTGDYENRSKLYQLSSFLRNKKLAKNIEVIAKAKVPIIKFVDPQSNIHVDISFERTNGILAAKKIRKWLANTPGLREIVLVVKQFLRSRKLNNVHVGGLGGYATIIICYSFLKLHPRIATSNMNVMDNLGALLIEFFELYGRNFSYDDLILSIDPETELPRYLLKKNHRMLNTSKNPFAIVIQDPSDETNNITRSSYNLRDIKKAFGGAFQILVDKCYHLNAASYKERLGQSILGDIIKYRGEERDFNDDRDKVVNHALVNESDDEESGNNDKYYFSDMTVESEDETFTEPKSIEEERASRKRASDLMSVGDEESVERENSDSEEETDKPNSQAPSSLPKKPKTNLDKDVRRDFWKKKGLEF